MTAAERIVVETNTIVSGILLPRSVPGRLFSFVAEHGTFVFSAATRDELLHVIAREKFDRYVSAEARERAVVILVRDSEIVVPRRSFQICRDPKGRHFVKTTITISSRGVITLPAKLRQALGLKAEVVEARRNLATKGSAAVAAFEASLLRVRASPAQVPGPALKELDWLREKDRPVVAAAMRLRCDALVTGDRTHFGPGYGKIFGGVAIHSPRSLAESLFG